MPYLAVGESPIRAVDRPTALHSPEMANVVVRYWVLESEKPSTFAGIYENSAFLVTFANGTASFSFKSDLPNHMQAESAVARFLTSWEAECAFQGGVVRRQFVLQGSDGPGTGTRTYFFAKVNLVGPENEAHARRETPWEFRGFEDFPVIESLIRRFEDHLRGREKLAVLAYFSLTVLEKLYGGRDEFGRILAVDKKILSQLGRLTSTVGTYVSARKVGKRHDLREFTPQEMFWIESAVRALIQRVGAFQKGEPVSTRLFLSDLPPLSHAGLVESER